MVEDKLLRRGIAHWLATIPATFMTAVSATYLLQAPEGFKLSTSVAYPAGVAIAAAVLVVFLTVIFKRNVGRPVEMPAPATDAK